MTTLENITKEDTFKALLREFKQAEKEYREQAQKNFFNPKVTELYKERTITACALSMWLISVYSND